MSTKTTVFIVVIAVLLAVAGLAARNSGSKEGMLVAGGKVPSVANGLAITGEFAAVATFLGLVGGVSLVGFSGFVIVLGVPLGFLVLLAVVAEPLRRTGHFTVADMFAEHMPSRGLRILLGLTGLVISALFMLGQFVGGASLLGVFFGLSYGWSVLIIGMLTLALVLVGGMRSATAVQVVKTVLLLAASVALLLLTLRTTSWNPFELSHRAAEQFGPSAIAPKHGATTRSMDDFSAVLATALGIAGMPHITVRFLTVRSGSAARQSALIALWSMSVYLIIMGFVGYGAAELVGRAQIAKQNAGGTTATIQLSQALGGEVFGAIVAGLVFAIIAAVLAGLLVSMMGIISHDLYLNVRAKNRSSNRAQVIVARVGAVVVTVLVSLLSFGARDINLIFIGTFAFGVAGSTIFPVIVFSLYWRKFALIGALATLGVGLASSLVLLVLGPNVLGTAAIFPYSQPAFITIPLAFLVGAVVTAARPATREAMPASDTLEQGRI